MFHAVKFKKIAVQSFAFFSLNAPPSMVFDRKRYRDGVSQIVHPFWGNFFSIPFPIEPI